MEIRRVLAGLKWYSWMVAAHNPSAWLRIFLFRAFGGAAGAGCHICYGVEIRGFKSIEIGCRTMIGTGCVVDGRGGCVVECDANISSGVMIWTAKHRHGNDSFDTVLAPVRIGRHCWVGPRSIIMPGVSVGRGAVICGGAVVTKSVPPFAIVAGIPAKVIGVRQGGVGYMLDSDYPFF